MCSHCHLSFSQTFSHVSITIVLRVVFPLPLYFWFSQTFIHVSITIVLQVVFPLPLYSSLSQTFIHVSITRWKHRKCSLFLKYINYLKIRKLLFFIYTIIITRRVDRWCLFLHFNKLFFKWTSNYCSSSNVVQVFIKQHVQNKRCDRPISKHGNWKNKRSWSRC